VRARAAVAVLPLAFALALWGVVAVPAQRERDLARTDYARAREERERLRAQVIALEHRASGGRAAPAGAATARALRASLLAAAGGLPVGAVQLAASMGQGHVAARGRLSAVGRTTAVLRLAERLASSGSGLVLERVELTAYADEASGIRVDVDVHSEGTGP
jgi:hypothetical protein